MTSPQSDQVDMIVAQWRRERPDLDSSPMGVLGRISRLAPLINQRLCEVFAQHGLDFPAFDVLAALMRSGEPYELTPGELATSMMVTPGAVAQRLPRLEARGLITRAHDNPDRRKVTVSLTPVGLQTIHAAAEDHCANEARLLSGFSAEERETLSGLLRRLVLELDN